MDLATFQSTPPCGGDQLHPLAHCLQTDFNPRPLAGATSLTKSGFSTLRDFNPRPLAGATLTSRAGSPWRSDFNPRPLAGATTGYNNFSWFPPHFNPRPLAGATVWLIVGGRRPAISIHAPLRGRQSCSQIGKSDIIFQSTPPCGGDDIFADVKSRDRDFNPRPLAGATNLKAARIKLAQISIHAPLRGRLHDLFPADPGGHFNPRPLAGATAPDLWGNQPQCNFNPRPLAGATDNRVSAGRHECISIHAPLRGRHDLIAAGATLDGISIHAPLRGRRKRQRNRSRNGRFQSTPPCGGDSIGVLKETTRRYFNPRPLAGATSHRDGEHQSSPDFNPRPLAGAT